MLIFQDVRSECPIFYHGDVGSMLFSQTFDQVVLVKVPKQYLKRQQEQQQEQGIRCFVVSCFCRKLPSRNFHFHGFSHRLFTNGEFSSDSKTTLCQGTVSSIFHMFFTPRIGTWPPQISEETASLAPEKLERWISLSGEMPCFQQISVGEIESCSNLSQDTCAVTKTLLICCI